LSKIALEVQAVKVTGKVAFFTLAVFLVLAGAALAQGMGFLWNGTQWAQLSYDAKVGYVKGVGNLADFETAAAKGKGPWISVAFTNELKTKTVGQVIDDVDKYYKENPTKLDSTVLEVIVMRCTKACPPGMGAGAMK
jgi:hypothetical protein